MKKLFQYGLNHQLLLLSLCQYFAVARLTPASYWHIFVASSFLSVGKYLKFLSIYKNSKIQVGNSSAGIIESASIPIPVVNVGIRQLGREINENVIFCDTNIDSIDNSIKQALSEEFCKKVKEIKNIYGDGKSSFHAYEIIKNTDFQQFLYKTNGSDPSIQRGDNWITGQCKNPFPFYLLTVDSTGI